MNRVDLSGTIVKLPCQCFKTKKGNKVVNNQIEVMRDGQTFGDRFFFTAWGENAELLTKANSNSIVEISGKLRTETFTDKNKNKITKTVVVVEKVDFIQLEVEEVNDTRNLDSIEITDDDLPF